MQPFSKRSPSFDPWAQLFSWLIYAPLALLGGCFAGRVVLEIVASFARTTEPINLSNRSGHIVTSIATGTCMALLLTALWYRLLYRSDIWWVFGNIVVMSAAVYSVLLILPWTLAGEHDLFPLGWLPVTVASGIGISIFQWYFVRSRTPQAISWFLLMNASWILIWFGMVGLNWLVDD